MHSASGRSHVVESASGSYSVSGNDCTASNQAILLARQILCASLVQADTVWCGTFSKNVTVSEDWPNQAVYMHNLLASLLAADASSPGCLNSTFARDTVQWLDSPYMADPQYSGLNFMATYLVFQVQYYDMPRKPGNRIEAPDTLGRKCVLCTTVQYCVQQLLLRTPSSVHGDAAQAS